MPYKIDIKFRTNDDVLFNTEVEERDTLEEVASCISYYESFFEEVLYTVTNTIEYIVATETNSEVLEDNSREITFTKNIKNYNEMLTQLESLKAEALYMQKHGDEYPRDYDALTIAIKLLKTLGGKDE